MKQRFKQWTESTEYILSIADAGNLSDIIILKKRLKSNFQKLRSQVQKIKKAEYASIQIDCFTNNRHMRIKHDCYESWKLYVKKYMMAKRFI